ncbi:AbrB family transcriptional regulator [Psychromarinibacter sp. C21-152]|uniref:AbrB family transcriptional regulator n=1 Tax=Psychromarinibacter sediminicola TaxID=3033385 RepID=A0AAE3T7S0_9RHOB|nr:AbrB family transcriptional regulator [Psychromarinibacter sediminicola]MDF0600605.1 AbrB family transcriptional regulator [Psychromarinibacter sediminicola]
MGVLTAARLRSVIYAAAGSAVFVVLGLPLPLLLGPMLGCLVAALAGQRLQGMGVLGTAMRTILGVAIGASITPELVAELPGYAPTLALIPVFVAVIGGIGYPFFRRVMGFDHPTAFYSAMPGGLQDMLIFGEEAGGDVRAMSLVHATRVLVIVTVAPFLLTWWYGFDLTAPPGQSAAEVPLRDLALMVVAGLGGWKLAERVRLFGASIIGPLVATAGLSLAGLIEARPPAEMIWAAQFFIGLGVGAGYTGITARELRVDVGAGLAFSLMLAAISLVFIEAVMWISPAPALDVMLSFLPGGQGEMVVIALVVGADLAFVVTHHLLRVAVVILLAPVFARMTGK